MAKKNEELQANARLLGNLSTLQGKKKEIPTASKEEAAERKQERRTQGKKGAKLTRIAASFTPEAIEYIKVMSKIRGESMSEFIEHVLMQHKADNIDFYNQVLEIRKNT